MSSKKPAIAALEAAYRRAANKLERARLRCVAAIAAWQAATRDHPEGAAAARVSLDAANEKYTKAGEAFWETVHELHAATRYRYPLVKKLPPTLTFGKHKNKPLGQVPVGYLRWALETVDRVRDDPELREEIEAQLGLLSPERMEQRAALAAEFERLEAYYTPPPGWTPEAELEIENQRESDFGSQPENTED